MADHSSDVSEIELIIEDARNGKMFILVDHEDRENEGDLVIPGQMATPNVQTSWQSTVEVLSALRYHLNK